MVARGHGHVVGVSSIAAFGALPRHAGYSAPKAGLSMFLECLRMDLAHAGVCVTAVHPGFVRTPMTARSRQPMPFLMDADAAADVIVRALPSGPATIDFPRTLALAARVGGALPRPVRDLILGRVVRDGRGRDGTTAGAAPVSPSSPDAEGVVRSPAGTRDE